MRKQSSIIWNLLFISIFLFITQFRSLGQPGELDSTFNGTGRVFTGTTNKMLVGFSNGVQADGKLLVAGMGYHSFTSYPQFATVRYNIDGTLDSSFGHLGKVMSDFGGASQQVNSMAVTKEGEILVGGRSQYENGQQAILARYNTDGKLDSSFGVNGSVIREFNSPNIGGEEIFAVKLFSDGKFLVGIQRIPRSGFQTRYFLFKFYATGVVDSSFGTLGSLELDYEGMWGDDFIEIQPDGKFLIVNSRKVQLIDNIELCRYLSNGQPDLSFNGTGHVNSMVDSMGASGFGVKSQADGKILVTGTVRRINNYVTGGPASDLVLVRYNSNGKIDSTFANNGIVITNINETDSPTGGIALQADGKIVLGITVDSDVIPEGIYGVVRYFPNGSLDSGFANNGKKVLDFTDFEGVCYGMQLYSNRIYLSGWANRVDANQWTTGFNTFAIQNDGIPLTPVFKNLCAGYAGNSFSSDMPGATYQWQISTNGTSFKDINDDNNYSGTSSLTLLLNNSSSSWNGYRYRCVTDKGISNVFTLQFMNTWTGAKSIEWEDPGNWSCGSLPDSNTDVVIKQGPVVINSNTSIRSLNINPGVTFTVNPGFDLNIVPKTSVN